MRWGLASHRNLVGVALKALFISTLLARFSLLKIGFGYSFFIKASFFEGAKAIKNIRQNSLYTGFWKIPCQIHGPSPTAVPLRPVATCPISATTRLWTTLASSARWMLEAAFTASQWQHTTGAALAVDGAEQRGAPQRSMVWSCTLWD